jgi:hypothetical protein
VSSYASYAAAIAAVDSSISKADTTNRPLGAEINAARFFYMDKFIMLVREEARDLLLLSYCCYHTVSLLVPKIQIDFTLLCMHACVCAFFSLTDREGLCQPLHIPQ